MKTKVQNEGYQLCVHNCCQANYFGDDEERVENIEMGVQSFRLLLMRLYLEIWAARRKKLKFRGV